MTLVGARLKASMRSSLLKGIYKGGTCKGRDIGAPTCMVQLKQMAGSEALSSAGPPQHGNPGPPTASFDSKAQLGAGPPHRGIPGPPAPSPDSGAFRQQIGPTWRAPGLPPLGSDVKNVFFGNVDFGDADFGGESDANEGGEDFVIGGSVVNSDAGMNNGEVGPSKFWEKYPRCFGQQD